MTKVAAVVVTFNRAKQLETVLEHVLGQTYKPDVVFVVDNASTDSTDTVLKRYESHEFIVAIRLEKNVGGAGGFAAGMTHAYESGADYVWVMDDDCYPSPDALSELVAGLDKAEQTLGRPLSYACSVVLWTDGSICEMNNAGTTWDWARLLVQGQQAVLVEYCSFVSVLIPRKAITRHGLPLAEYFIWYDDVEYTRRIGRSAPGVQVLASTVKHDIAVNAGVNFGQINHANIWKYEYGIRNEGSYRLHYEGVGSFMTLTRTVLAQIIRGKVPWVLRIRALRSLLRGISFNPKPRYARSVL